MKESRFIKPAGNHQFSGRFARKTLTGKSDYRRVILRSNRLIKYLTLALFVISLLAGCNTRSGQLSKLDVLKPDYPKVVFFRQSEATRLYETYEAWEDNFDDAMGFIAQGFPWQMALRHKWGNIKNSGYFTRFKEYHPNQVILIHRDSQENDPRGPVWFSEEDFYPGHWLYFNGATIMSDVPVEDGLTEIHVSDASLFHLGVGFDRDQEEEIGLFMLDGSGKPDWNRCEQVRLTAADTIRNIITVIRGQYGTEPLAFPAGKAWAASHVVGGPWDSGHLTWSYNYSTFCPRDEKGRSCTDVLVEYLVRDFGPGGIFYNIDGFAEDYIMNAPRCSPNISRGRLPDFDGDGKGDEFLTDKTWATGVIEYYRKLREEVGEDRLITSDAQTIDNQRAFGIMNGVEMERWPEQHANLRKWSCGINTNLFWDQNAREPKFSYNKVYYGGPYTERRLRFAGSVFTNAAVSISQSAQQTAETGIWDEMCMGQENRLGWLGKALSPAVPMALSRKDELEGQGSPPRQELVQRLKAGHTEITLDNGAIKISSDTTELRFYLEGVRCNGPDLTVFITALGEPINGFPAEYARLIVATTGRKGLPLPDNLQHALTENNRLYSFINDKPFTSSFYFQEIVDEQVDIEFTIEGGEPAEIIRIEIYSHPDAMYREFEHGVVLGNPSPAPYTFDLEALFPGQVIRRIAGSDTQDPVTNDGSAVSGTVTLQGRDGLFLIKE